jgi:hypothetical protein
MKILIKKFIEMKISEIADSDFQSLVTELCHCVSLDREQFINQPLSFLLMAIVRENRAMTRQHLLVDGILTMKVDKVSTDSVLYQVCKELANFKGMTVEAYGGKTILSLIKNCYKATCPKLLRQKTRKLNIPRY